MFERVKIQDVNDYFKELGKRSSRGIYFCRINGYNETIRDFVIKYYEAARASGAVIEGRLPNPDQKNLDYYHEMMGTDFQMNQQFFDSALKKWLPRMNDSQRSSVVTSLYATLVSLKNSGKNENMLKNAYIKFMCWLYYKFEQLMNQLGNEKVPKILYEGSMNNYELMLMEILANAGCDVVLLQYEGDRNYLNLDPHSLISEPLEIPGAKAFPADFNLEWIRKEIQNRFNRERLYGKKPEILNATNIWIRGSGLEDVKTAVQSRGEDKKLFYNCFLRIAGVEDKTTYLNELYQFQMELKNSGRRVVIVNQKIPLPDSQEISAVQRKNYTRQEDMIMDLSGNIRYPANLELQRVMVKAFVDILLEESQLADTSLNRLTNKAVILLCWLARYQEKLFYDWKMPEIGCFLYMGGCKNDNEAMFVRFLARLPVDVVIFTPDGNGVCCVQDKLLYEKKYGDSLEVDEFPEENSDIRVGTVAYHAERELDTLMYNDSGMYRNQQYGKANTILLKTMYEEISILWNQEVKYRPNFSTVNDVVNIPVIFAKVSGVRDGSIIRYWKGIESMMTPETFLIRKVPFVDPNEENPFKQCAAGFLKDGKIQREKIKAHGRYPYGVLREETQEYILDKMQMLIDKRTIKGTFENGTEYAIISTVLNMKKDLVRMIQNFDFTRINPKIVYINTTETAISLEDSILTAYLSLAGFDVVFFVPTGYQSIEKYFNKRLMEEYQTGEYLYDLRIPDFNRTFSSIRQSWRDKIFKRGT